MVRLLFGKGDRGKLTVCVGMKAQQILFFPVSKRSLNIFFRMIEYISNRGERQFSVRVCTAQKIKLDFDVFSAGVWHVLVNKSIMNHSESFRCVRINFHDVLPRLLSHA